MESCWLKRCRSCFPSTFRNCVVCECVLLFLHDVFIQVNWYRPILLPTYLPTPIFIWSQGRCIFVVDIFIGKDKGNTFKMPMLISVSEFIEETREDYNSPPTSTFVSRMPQCRNTISSLEEVHISFYYHHFIACFLIEIRKTPLSPQLTSSVFNIMTTNPLCIY